MLENIRGGRIISIDTAANGTDYTSFENPTGRDVVAMEIINDSGTDIEFIRDAGEISITVADGDARLVLAVGGLSEIKVRRVDQTATPVTVKAEIFY